MSSSAAPSRFAVTPEPPYLIVTFASQRIIGEDDGYGEMAVQMGELAAKQPGYLGIESARDAEGFGITNSFGQTKPASMHGSAKWTIWWRRSSGARSGMKPIACVSVA